MNALSTTNPAMQTAYLEAQKTWPGILISWERFNERVALAISTSGSSPMDLVLKDLYLVAAIEDGNHAAWERFYVERFHTLVRLANRFCENEEDAEEIIQQFASDLPVRLHCFAGRCSLAGWLAVVIPNIVRDHYRRLERETSLDARLDKASATDDQASADFSSDLSDQGNASAETRNGIDRSKCGELLSGVLNRAMNFLKPEWRDLIYYKYMRGLSSREIAAAIFHIKEDVISKWLKKALAKLQGHARDIAQEEHRVSKEELQDCLETLLE
jgi:RNA polymerase sigma factor (sigma-70 family)